MQNWNTDLALNFLIFLFFMFNSPIYVWLYQEFGEDFVREK
jgi:hypothetical protein